MLHFNPESRVLEEEVYQYTLQDVDEPVLYREIFTYDEVPKVVFNHRIVPMDPPERMYISDTTFRDGQQSMAPFSTKQIVDLYDLLHRLSGPQGVIRQCEFFVYSERDREAVRQCQERGYEFPEVTGWIRATRRDFQLVREMGIKETGILTSSSDYHIFRKLNKKRSEAMEGYLAVVKMALEEGILPRCHLEDITRADFYGFVVPFVLELMKLAEEARVPIKIRACDTMGFGVSYPGVALPRSVPGIAYGLHHYAGLPSELLEWHGHNDFYRAVVNSGTAWLYGISSVNCTLLGIGERTGNTPLEAMVFEYAALRGTTDGMQTQVISEIADYYRKVIGYEIPPMTPLVGSDFTTTRAGIHADGLLKDEEIYNIFDTKALLNRPVRVLVNQSSGAAGITHWANTWFGLQGERALDKHDSRLQPVLAWVSAEYQGGRSTVIGDEELEQVFRERAPELYAEITSDREMAGVARPV